MLKEIIVNPKTGDKTDDYKTDGDKMNDKQPDITDIPDLESLESAEQRRRQKGKRLKILTPDQMLSRLPITLARLKAGNNSEKRKYEIMKLLHSLYRLKKLTKTIYNNMINIV